MVISRGGWGVPSRPPWINLDGTSAGKFYRSIIFFLDFHGIHGNPMDSSYCFVISLVFQIRFGSSLGSFPKRSLLSFLTLVGFLPRAIVYFLLLWPFLVTVNDIFQYYSEVYGHPPTAQNRKS